MDIATLLKKDLMKNISLVYFMENYAHSTEQHGDSVILRGKSDRKWTYISCYTEPDLVKIMTRLSLSDKAFAAIEDWMRPQLLKDKKITWELNCHRYYLPKDRIEHSFPELPALKPEDAEHIFEKSKYKEILTLDYVKERISNGISSCIREREKLIGWAMNQDDGSMGFLQVLNEHRGKGHAMHLTMDLAKKINVINHIPFVQIETTNTHSLELVKKAGFVFDRKLHWFMTE